MSATASRAYHVYFIVAVSYDDKKKGRLTQDNLIQKIVGRKSDSSGYNLVTGMRDVEFRFEKENAAENVMAKLKAAGFKCSLQEYERDTP